MSTDSQREVARLDVEGGKYTFLLLEGDYRVHVLRFGERWLEISAGHKAIAALVWEMLALQPSKPNLSERDTD